ncbi:hypothetical protein D3C75_893250 [compost metagenome]
MIPHKQIGVALNSKACGRQQIALRIVLSRNKDVQLIQPCGMRQYRLQQFPVYIRHSVLGMKNPEAGFPSAAAVIIQNQRDRTNQ